jgi:hypothetical protein
MFGLLGMFLPSLKLIDSHDTVTTNTSNASNDQNITIVGDAVLDLTQEILTLQHTLNKQQEATEKFKNIVMLIAVIVGGIILREAFQVKILEKSSTSIEGVREVESTDILSQSELIKEIGNA